MPDKWQGMRDDVSQTSEQGVLVNTNTSYRNDGELTRRPGLSSRIDVGAAGLLCQEFRQPVNGSYALFFSSAGNLIAVNMSSLTATTVKTGLSATYRGGMTKSQARAYFVNDFDKMQVIERGDATCNDAGITGPAGDHPAATSTASGAGTTGTHRVRYRYKNSKSGYVSNPSGELSLAVVSSTNGSNTFPIGTTSTSITRSVDAKVDTLVIEMTAVNGTDFYQATTAANTASTVTVALSDTALTAGTNVTAFFGDFGHEPPPLGAIVTEHRGRLFLWGATERSFSGVAVTNSSTNITGTGFSTNWTGRQVQVDSDTRIYTISAASSSTLVLSENYQGSTSASTTLNVFSNAPDTLYWSRPGFPESWKPLEQARRVLQNEADTPAGMISQNDVLYLFGQRSQRKLIYTNDPATGKLVHIPTNMGVWNQQCLVEADGLIYGFGRAGIFVTEGSGPQHLSKPVDDTILDGNTFAGLAALDPAYFTEFHGVYDQRERCVTFFYVKSGDTTPKNGVSYYVDDGTWRLDQYRQAIRSSTQAAGSTNQVRAMLADENGYAWFLVPNRFDGVPSTMTSSGTYTGVVTCAAGSSTTILQISAPSLPTGTGTDLVGCILTDSTGANERRITANTSTTITLSSALSSSPSAGTEFWVGSIPLTLRTKWWVGDGLTLKKDVPYLCISVVPSAAGGKLLVSIFADYAATPSAFTAGSSDTQPDGVTWTDGATFATVDLDGGNGDGVVCFRPPVRWSRALSARIQNLKPLGDLKILDVSWSMTDPRQQVRGQKD